ncbi:MAG: Membrane endopeptidase, M50 family [Candidatus Gottesmanbacteria bacterium GW2011_GWC2_39_8]|uniref:Zinc metalloprotease n=1 Tax=Candidatus Gottesmanbacteria bacterium GW2011_GWC2_39_8 TaxID=1618450 RepID=A0A0G0PY13_9BACT|nr:MAG: Membrane endopeptidase, M50 family [Candidatus Gottesmanbacteria bacterium GW2011_GWC2_39_8]
MFGKRVTLFKLLGFQVRIDLSWLILVVLITWSLAHGYFPFQYKNLPEAIYWWMGAAGTVGLFVSIIFHELCHSLVARRFGLPMRGITLFVFGGVAEMDEEPPSAKAEFLMAVAGPISSVLLGGIFYAMYLFTYKTGWPILVFAVLNYLAILNWLLASFNLLPAYPLDGGRVLRSALWEWKKNIRWATRIASQIGAGFGIALIVFGVLNIVSGVLIGGIWWFLIGMFLRNAAQTSYQQILVRKSLEGEKVRDFMKPEPVTAPSSISIEKLVEDYIYKYHYKMFPVVENDRLIGCITTRQVKDLPREQWASSTIMELVSPCSEENTIGPEEDAMKSLSIMNRSGNSRLMVIDKGKLVGIITLKDIMGFLSIKVDLGEDETR